MKLGARTAKPVEVEITPRRPAFFFFFLHAARDDTSGWALDCRFGSSVIDEFWFLENENFRNRAFRLSIISVQFRF